jgi:DNA replication regulator SLD3
MRNPLFQAVQISATPKANRQKDMFARPQHSSSERRVDDSFVIPPSSLPKIPQSVVRSSGGLSSRNPFLSSVQATPTRKSVPAFSRNIDTFSVDHPPSSPLHMRRSSGQLFTVVPASTIKIPSASRFLGITDTPIKSMTGHGHSIDLEMGSNKENLQQGEIGNFNQNQHDEVTNEDSIYKALGWDDVDDLDELA